MRLKSGTRCEPIYQTAQGNKVEKKKKLNNQIINYKYIIKKNMYKVLTLCD